MRLTIISIAVLWVWLASAHAESLSWHFQGLNAQNQSLLRPLEAQQVFRRFNRTVRQHVRLNKPVHVVFYPGAETFFDPQRDELLIPLNILQRMQHDLAQRFPEQEEVQHAVYIAAVEYLLWYQLARVLVYQYDLPAASDAAHSIDAFATLAMLDSKQGLNQLYLLDAVEAFLRAVPSFTLWGDLSRRSEDEQNEARYRFAMCLVMGADHRQFPELLEEQTWNQQRLDRCQQRLQAARSAWSQRLGALLSEWSPWRKWREAGTGESEFAPRSETKTVR